MENQDFKQNYGDTTPSVGDIVHYIGSDYTRYAAMIIEVVNSNCQFPVVNLRISFPNYDERKYFVENGMGPSHWQATALSRTNFKEFT